MILEVHLASEPTQFTSGPIVAKLHCLWGTHRNNSVERSTAV